MDWYIWALIFSLVLLIIAVIGSVARKDWEKGGSYVGIGILLLALLTVSIFLQSVWLS